MIGIIPDTYFVIASIAPSEIVPDTFLCFALYLSLGDSPAARAHAYRACLMSGTNGEELAIRPHIMQEKALGSPRFQAMLGHA